MKSTIKKFAKKILPYVRNPSLIMYSKLTDSTFPEHPASLFRVNARLTQSLWDVKKSDLTHNIGSLYPKANRYATRIFASFLPYNPNNIGNWSTSPDAGGTRQLEYELIHKLVHLYQAEKEHIEGYVTSGGTEGNLYSVWIGKSYLLTFVTLDQLCLLKTKLAHYSLDKACHMCSIPQVEVPMHPGTWTMDPNALALTMIKQITLGRRGFIISLTMGYTETGTSDDIQNISRIVNTVIQRYKNIHVSIIIDAAFDGLILPFVTDDFHPFMYDHVHALSVDFSKFTAIPYPAAVVLYRKQLRKLIEKGVPVFSIKDNTLAGSRPGAPVAAMWAIIHRLGKQKFREIIINRLQLKQYFIAAMKKLFPDSEIISTPHSLTCGIILHKKRLLRFPAELEKRYWLYAKKTKFSFSNRVNRTVILYKFFFLQHITKRSYDDFLKDVQRSLGYGKQ